MAIETIHTEYNELTEKIQKNVFVDRDDCIALFNKEFEELSKDKSKSSAMYFWGISGSGKSSLLSHLSEIALDKKSPVVKLNLKNNTNLIVLLHQFALFIKENKACRKFEFITFFTALLKYNRLCEGKHKFYTGSIDGTDSESLSEVLLSQKDVLFSQAEKLLEETPYVKEIIAFIKGGKSLLEFSKKIITFYSQEFQKKAGDLYKRIDEAKNAEDLFSTESDLLLRTFIFDMNYNMQKRYDSFLPLVVFLDTFESYDKIQDPTDPEFDQDWLFGPASNPTKGMAYRCDNVMWVVSGQNKIQALDYKTENGNYYVQRLENDTYRNGLEMLQKEDVKQWITNLDIDMSDEIVDQIWEVSKGLPVYVSVCLEYYAEKNGEVDVDGFSGKIEDIVNKYLYTKDYETTNMIKLMSTLGEWSDTDFKNLLKTIKGLNYNNSLIIYDRLVRKSYISYDGFRRRIFHEKVRDIIFKSIEYGTEIKHQNYMYCITFMHNRLNDNLTINDLSYYTSRLLDLIEKRCLTVDDISKNNTTIDLTQEEFDNAVEEELKKSVEVVKDYYYKVCKIDDTDELSSLDVKGKIDYIRIIWILHRMFIVIGENPLYAKYKAELCECNYFVYGCSSRIYVSNKQHISATQKVLGLLENEIPSDSSFLEDPKVCCEIGKLYAYAGIPYKAMNYYEKAIKYYNENINTHGSYDHLKTLVGMGDVFNKLASDKSYTFNERQGYAQSAGQIYNTVLSLITDETSLYKANINLKLTEFLSNFLNERYLNAQIDSETMLICKKDFLEAYNDIHKVFVDNFGENNSRVLLLNNKIMLLENDIQNLQKETTSTNENKNVDINDMFEIIENQHKNILKIQQNDYETFLKIPEDQRIVTEEVSIDKTELFASLDYLSSLNEYGVNLRKFALTLDDENKKRFLLASETVLTEATYLALKKYPDNLINNYSLSTMYRLNLATTQYCLEKYKDSLKNYKTVYYERIENQVNPYDQKMIGILYNICHLAHLCKNKEELLDVVNYIKNLVDIYYDNDLDCYPKEISDLSSMYEAFSKIIKELEDNETN